MLITTETTQPPPLPGPQLGAGRGSISRTTIRRSHAAYTGARLINTVNAMSAEDHKSISVRVQMTRPSSYTQRRQISLYTVVYTATARRYNCINVTRNNPVQFHNVPSRTMRPTDNDGMRYRAAHTATVSLPTTS